MSKFRIPGLTVVRLIISINYVFLSLAFLADYKFSDLIFNLRELHENVLGSDGSSVPDVNLAAGINFNVHLADHVAESTHNICLHQFQVFFVLGAFLELVFVVHLVMFGT